MKGRKRHILVDTLGLLLAVVVTSAALSDPAGATTVAEALGRSLQEIASHLGRWSLSRSSTGMGDPALSLSLAARAP